MIAQVGDGAEAGIVHQVGAQVIAQALDQRGEHQRKGHHVPGIVHVQEMRTPESSGRSATGCWGGRGGWGLRARRASEPGRRWAAAERMRKVSSTPTRASSTTPGSHSSGRAAHSAEGAESSSCRSARLAQVVALSGPELALKIGAKLHPSIVSGLTRMRTRLRVAGLSNCREPLQRIRREESPLAIAIMMTSA